MGGMPSNKISCIFGDIDCMETINSDFERSREVLVKYYQNICLNVGLNRVRSDRKLIMMYVRKEDEWKSVSQYQMHLRRY